MSANIDERIVSIKFDNSGFSQKISETQNDLEEFNKSLSFDGIKKGVETITEGFKNISVEAKKADLSPMAESIDKVGEKFKVLETIAVGALLKIGAQAVELGEKLVKSLTIDRLAEGYKKYESILTSQMTLTAALGGKTEEEVAQNAEKIERVLKQLTWYADETSYSLNDMISNVSKFANYGIDLDKAKTAMMGIANASAKSGAPIANASHAMEGFSKAMGQGYMSYQVWRTWMTSAQIGTVDFKNTFLETAKTMIKEGKSLGDAVKLVGDDLEYYAGKAEGWKKITEGTFEESLTKGRWMNTDVMLQGLSKYSAAMDDLYNQSQAVGKSVTEILESGAEGFDQFSVEAFKYGQQCKTLSDVFDSLFDATSTTWYRIFQALIGDYKQTVDLWSSFAEYIFEWFVYPLQSVADAIEDFSVKNSNIINEMTGEYMTMREVIVGSFTNILEAIKSVIDPIKEAFNAIFRPAEELPDKIQNGIEKFYDFTKGLKLTGEQIEKLRTTFLNIFQVIKTVINVIKTVIKLLKDTLYPVVKKVGEFAVTIITTVFKALYKLASWISSFISKVFGVRDVVADMKDSVIEAAESFDKISESAEQSAASMQKTASEYSEVTSSLEDVTEGANDVVEAMEKVDEAAEESAKKSKKAAKEKSYAISGGYDGSFYLDYMQAQEKANNQALASLIKQYNITEDQYTRLIKYMQEEDAGHLVDLRDVSSNLGISVDAAINLMDVLRKTTSAAKATERVMIHSLKASEDTYEEYETIYDGILKAQQETMITEADNMHIIDLYFNKGVKDYEVLARSINGEIWKVQEVIEAYEEAYKVEQYLNKNKLEATKENIQLAREELGYIKKTAEESNKAHQEEKKRRQELYQWQKFSFKERERTSSKEAKQITDISRQIANASEFSRTELTTSWNQYYGDLSEEAEDVAESVESIADASESATKKISNNAGQMAEAFKTVSEEAQTASESVSKGVQTMSDEVQAASSGTSYADRVKKMFGELDDSSLLDGFTGTVKEKVTGITDWLKGVKERILQGFAKIGDEFSHFLDHPIETIKNVIGVIKKLITGIWQKQDSKGTGVAGASVVLDEEELKVTLSEKIKMVLTGVLYDIKKFLKEKLGDKGFDSLTDVLKKIMDFKDKVVKYFNRIKDAINVVFGEGSVWDKLANSTLWQPFVEAIDSIITKFDNLTIGIDKVKDAIETRFGGAFDQASENIHAHIENIRGWFKGLKDELDDFSQKVAIAKGEYIANDGEFESDWSKPVQIAAEIQTKVGDAWAKVKEKAQDVIDWFRDLDWQDILKIEALTSVVGQIAGIITRTWIGLNIAGMAKDIGGFFDNLSNGLSNLASAIGDKESLGTTLLKIAGGISLLAASIFLLSTIDNTAMENAVKTIKDLAIIIGVLIGVVALCVRLMNKGNKVLDFKGKSLPEMVGESLSTIFGSKNTMADMAKVIVGIGAGILLLSAAFAIILEATKDANPTQVAVAIGVLVGISVIVGLLFAAVFAMMQKINTIHSDALVVIKQRSVIDSLAEMLKWFAVAIAALVAALLTVKKVIEDCYDESGDLNEQKLVLILAIFTVLALLPVAVMATISKMAEGLQQHNVDPKLVDSLKTSLSSVMRSTVMLASAFKSILKAIDSVENPDSVGKAMQTMLLLCGFMLIMIIVMGIMAAIFTGKAPITDLAEANKLSGSTAKGIDIEGAKGLKIQNAKDISPALTAMGKVVIEIAIALKLMASAFQTIVTAVDKATDEKVFGRVIGVAIGMFLALGILIAEIGIIATKLNGVEIDAIKTLGIAVLEIAGSMVLLGIAMKTIVSAFDKADPDAVNKAMATAGVFLLAVMGLFAVLAVLEGTGHGAGLTSAVTILLGIAGAMLMISSAVYVLAKGLQEMTVAMSMLAESGKDFIAVLETIRDAMPIIKDIIIGAIEAIIVGIVGGIAGSIEQIISMVIEGFTRLLEQIAANAPRIQAAFEQILPLITTIIGGIITAIFEALNNSWPSIEEFLNRLLDFVEDRLTSLLDWLDSEGLPRLEDMILSIVKFLIEEVLPEIEQGIFGFLDFLRVQVLPELLGILTDLWNGVMSFINDEVFPDLEETWDNLLKFIGDCLDDLYTHTEEWARDLIDWVVDLIDTVNEGVKDITDAVERLLTTVVDSILDLFETGGKLLAKLLTIPKKIHDGFWEEIRNQFGLNKDGKATTSGAIFTAGKNIIQGLIDGIKAFISDIATLAKDLAKRFLDALRGKDGLDEHSPSKATEKIGRFAGIGFVNGVKESSRDVANSAITMAEAFMNPMASELEAFSVTTSSLIGQLIDANLDANPVITPVIDMTNFDRAQESMSSFFDSQKALDVATSFSTMKAAEDLAKINQNGSNDTEPVAPVYNYTQNNYSPKALDPIEIYRRTHNQLKFAQSLNYGNAKGWA